MNVFIILNKESQTGNHVKLNRIRMMSAGGLVFVIVISLLLDNREGGGACACCLVAVCVASGEICSETFTLILLVSPSPSPSLLCCWAAKESLIPHIFQTRSVRVITSRLPVDDAHDSSHPDEKSSARMLVVISRPNVKSERCQSHTGDISIFLEGQAVTVNPPVPRWTLSLSGQSPVLREASNTLYSQHGLPPFL